MRAAQLLQFPGDPTEEAECLPRSGYTQQLGVAAQRRTLGSRLDRMYAEGVRQFAPGRLINPIRIARQNRRLTFETSVATHLETSLFDDVPAGSGRRLSKRPRVTDSPRTLHSPAAIETRRSSVSTTSKIPVSIHVPGRRSTTSSKADTEYGRDPRCHRSGVTGFRDSGMRPPGKRGVQISDRHFVGRVCGVSSKRRHAGKSARETDPCVSLFACGMKNRDACGTPSAYKQPGKDILGCATARRPQANECNRFAVTMLALVITVARKISRVVVNDAPSMPHDTDVQNQTPLPRSGFIRQPGVVAQRRTPGTSFEQNVYAEGVPHGAPMPGTEGRDFRA